MALTKQEVAQQFIARREKNLNFFRTRYPSLYKNFKDLKMTRVEVNVSTEATDVDLLVGGKSWYQGKAKAYGRKEAAAFLADYPSGKRIHSLRPPFVDTMGEHQYAAATLKQAIAHSPVRRENFDGYELGNFLPSVVFMGVGLGYHVEALLQSVDIVDAIIFEPDAEVFAATLFTLDWESVCRPFLERKGYSLRFLITSWGKDEHYLQRLLERELQKSEPLYPVTTTYYNHRAQRPMAQLVKAVGRDISANLTAWGDYDDEVRRLNNMLHSMGDALDLLVPGFSERSSLPVFIVGSGPSIDGRLEEIRKVRSQLILVSAGTGIRALVTNGLIPDFHVELDPQYLVYQHLAKLDRSLLEKITLLAVAEVNPLVPPLFRDCIFYLKDSNPFPQLFEAESHAFSFCNPTCTNAALSLFVQTGFGNLFLLGCDYGFQSHTNHHSQYSVYGDHDDSDIAKFLKKHTQARYEEKQTFKVESVNGDTIYSRPDYHAAKQHMESQIRHWKEELGPVKVNNCSDGAMIKGAPWMSGQAMMAAVSLSGIEVPPVAVLHQRFRTEALIAEPESQDAVIDDIANELRERTVHLMAEARAFRLQGRKDVTRLTRHVAALNRTLTVADVGQQPTPAQRVAAHIISGSVRRLLMAGYTHAMAQPNDANLTPFLKQWRAGLDGFLETVEEHFKTALTHRLPPHEDPLVNRSRWEPEAESTTASPDGGAG